MEHPVIYRFGFTLTEVLVIVVILAIFFSVMTIVLNGTLKSYVYSRYHVKSLYAENYIRFLFDVLETELMWAGSGAGFMKPGTATINVGGGTGSVVEYPRFGVYSRVSNVDRYTPFSEILNYVWVPNWGLDIRTSGSGLEIYVSHIKTYPVTLKRVGSSYVSLNRGILSSSRWAIGTYTLSTDSPSYFGFYINGITLLNSNGRTFEATEFSRSSTFTVLNAPSTAEYLYVVPPSTGLQLFNMDFGENFRRVRISYDPTSKSVRIFKYIPSASPPNNELVLDVLEDVSKFEVYLVRQAGSTYTFERVDPTTWNFRKPSVMVRDLVGLKFVVEWQSPWSFGNRKLAVSRERLIILPDITD